jgi:competence protein ComEC
MVAGLATAPYAAFHFNRIAAYGVVANVLAMPVISFVIMPAAAVTLLALPLGLEWYPLQVMGWGLEAMLWVAHETASWPGASSLVASAPPFALGLVTVGGLWLALWQGAWRTLGIAPIAAGMLLAVGTTGPDVLIDRDAANVAARGDDGRLAVVSGRRGRFAAEEWLERDGDSSELKDSARRGRTGVWTCADKICEATVAAARVVYMERAGDRTDACTRGAQIVVAAREIDPCPSGLTITPAQTRRNGAHAIVLRYGVIEVKTVRDELGERPWTVWAGQ